MTPSDTTKPDCFGCLDRVFPMTESGLRQSPERCIRQCTFKTECLRAALSGSTRAREEQVDHAYQAGLMTFLDRWSRKKQLKQEKKQPRNPKPNP